MSPSRLVFALAVALLAAAPGSAAAQSAASIQLTAAGKRALKPLSLSTAKLSVDKTTVASTATLTLDGSLRFKSGRRTASATNLKLSIGRTSSYVSARLGKKTVRLLSVKPTAPATLDPARGAVTLTGARIALTPAAAKALRGALKLKRTPSTKTLGTLSVKVPPAAPAPAPPAPAPITQPAASPTPAPTAAPTPPADGTSIEVPSCDPARMTATPAGSADWFGCHLLGDRDLRSWTRYVLTPSVGCPGGPGTIVASGGAARLLSNSAYDHRFPIAQALPGVAGGWEITLSGAITYSMPAHGIDEAISGLQLVVNADETTGAVYADGRSAPRVGVSCVTPAETYTHEKVMDLALTEGPPNFFTARATVAAPIGRLGGGEYAAGQPWGTFTFSVPGR